MQDRAHGRTPVDRHHGLMPVDRPLDPMLADRSRYVMLAVAAAAEDRRVLRSCSAPCAAKTRRAWTRVSTELDRALIVELLRR